MRLFFYISTHQLYAKCYGCPNCGGKTTTQVVDWYKSKSSHTKAYDRHLMLRLINSTVEDVSRKDDVGYKAVEGSIACCLPSQVNWDEVTMLNIMGIKVLKRHCYGILQITMLFQRLYLDLEGYRLFA